MKRFLLVKTYYDRSHSHIHNIFNGYTHRELLAAKDLLLSYSQTDRLSGPTNLATSINFVRSGWLIIPATDVEAESCFLVSPIKLLKADHFLTVLWKYIVSEVRDNPIELWNSTKSLRTHDELLDLPANQVYQHFPLLVHFVNEYLSGYYPIPITSDVVYVLKFLTEQVKHANTSVTNMETGILRPGQLTKATIAKLSTDLLAEINRQPFKHYFQLPLEEACPTCP